MDNLTHTLIGIGVARSGVSRRFGRGTTVTLAVASNLPDIDVLWTLWDRWDRFMVRRTHTHAILMLPVLAAMLAWGLRYRYREQSWKVLFGLSALGIGLHVLFDLVNSFGVVVLWPFSAARFELGSVFIVDPWIWAITLTPLLCSLWIRSESSRELAYRLSLGALAAYLILCLGAHARTESIVRDELARQNERAEVLRVFPEPLGPQRFRAAARLGNAWKVYLCSIVSGSAELCEVVPTQDDAPRVREIRASLPGRKLDWFMAAPVWTVRPDGAAEVYDLRFSNQVIARRPVFRVEFSPGGLTPIVR